MDTGNKLRKLTAPFHDLWNSARVTCIAVGDPYERRSVVTRIVLREVELPQDRILPPVLWLDQIPQILVAVVDLPKHAAVQVLSNAMDKNVIQMENDPVVDRVLLTWPLEQTSGAVEAARFAALSWSDIVRYETADARRLFGTSRTCLALIGTGDYIREIMPNELRRGFNSKLPLMSQFDGFEQLYGELLPGLVAPSDLRMSEQRVVQIVFPLPLDMGQAEDGNLFLVAPRTAHENDIQLVVNFRPSLPAMPLQPTRETAELTADGQRRQWRWAISWPPGAESGRASLFYAKEPVSSIEMRRWPAAGGLRAAIDSYFDPNHERLGKDLFGEDKKSGKDGKVQSAFEMAVVRLMSLHGIPLVWYGKGSLPRRNDAAGFVDKADKQVVVLAECTVENPQAKFSALKERAQELSDWLVGEAEVLPVVFTQTEPPESVFRDAYEHGIALVGRNELMSLFNMLSATTKQENGLEFLARFKRLIEGKYSPLD